MQVTVSMLCSDGTATASSLAMNAVSAALMCSNIPWNGPLAAVQLACNESQQGTTVQPSVAELTGSSMSGIYVGTADSVLLADFQVSHASQPPAPPSTPPPFAAYPMPTSPSSSYMDTLPCPANCSLIMQRKPHLKACVKNAPLTYNCLDNGRYFGSVEGLHAMLRRLLTLPAG